MVTGTEQKDRLTELIRQLQELGEDETELELWNVLFEVLDPADQQKILANLDKEITELRKLA